ncbi:MAG TPA: alpha/beta fold hydrolase [Sphingomicrobium sp.]|nr:alpha/beta fold hydrolase [Sphingomicrobium sp.]
MLHGYPQTHAMWLRVAPVFAHDYAVVCPDCRGYGDSGKPESDAPEPAPQPRLPGLELRAFRSARCDACSIVIAQIFPATSRSSSVFSSRSRVPMTAASRNSINRVSVAAKYRIFMARIVGRETHCELVNRQPAV